MKSIIKTNSIYLVLLLTSIDIVYSGCCKKKPSNNGSKTNLPGKPGSGPGKPTTPQVDSAFLACLERLGGAVDRYIKSKIANSKFNVRCSPFGSIGKIYIEFGKFHACSLDIKNIGEINVSDSNAIGSLLFELTIESFVDGSNYVFEEIKITLQALCGRINELNSIHSGIFVENSDTHYLKVSVHRNSDDPGVYKPGYIDLLNGALYAIHRSASSEDERYMLRYVYYGLVERGKGKGGNDFVKSFIGYCRDYTGKLGDYKNTPSGKSSDITKEAFRNFLTNSGVNLTKAENIASLSIKLE